MGNGASGPANVQASDELPVKPEQTDKLITATFLEIEDKQDVKRRKSNDLSAVIPQEYVEKMITNAPSTPTTSPAVVVITTTSNDMAREVVETFAEELDSFDAGPDIDYPLDDIISQRRVNSQQMNTPPEDLSAPSPALLPSPTTPVRLAITGSAKNPQQRNSSTSPELILSPSSSQHNSALLRSSSQNPPPSSPSKAPIDTTTARDQLLEMNARMDALLVQAADIATVRSNAKANAKAAAAAKIAAQQQSRNLASSSQSRIRSGESRRKSEVRPGTPIPDSGIPANESFSPKSGTSKSNTDVMDFLHQVEMKMRANTIAQAPLSSLTPAEFAFTLEQRAQERAAQKQLEQARRQGELEAMRRQFEGETKRKEAELELLRQQIRNADAALHIEALKDEVKRIANTGTGTSTSPITGTGTGMGIGAGTSPGTVSARAVVRIKAKPTSRATAVGISTGNAIIGTGPGTDMGTGMGASIGMGVASFSSRTSGTRDAGTGSHRRMGSGVNSGKGMGMGLNTGTSVGMSPGAGTGTGTGMDVLDILTAQHVSPTTISARAPLSTHITAPHTPSLSNHVPTRATHMSASTDPYHAAHAPLAAEDYRGHRGGSGGDAGSGVGGGSGSGMSSLRVRSVLASNAAHALTNNSQDNTIGAPTYSTGMGASTGTGTGTGMGMCANPISISSPMSPANINSVGGAGNDNGGASTMTNVNAALRAKTQRGMFSFDTGKGKSNKLLPQVAELAVLEHALRQDLAEDKALDAQLRETSLRVAALEKAAAEKRAKKALRQKLRERELEEL